nr:diguanylate cyclase [Thioalkalivibrio sp. ALJ3]
MLGEPAAAGFYRYSAETLKLMRARVAQHEFPGAGRVTISLGVAASSPGEPRTGLLRRVDEALYRAKGEGRNRVAVAALPEATS